MGKTGRVKVRAVFCHQGKPGVKRFGLWILTAVGQPEKSSRGQRGRLVVATERVQIRS